MDSKPNTRERPPTRVFDKETRERLASRVGRKRQRSESRAASIARSVGRAAGASDPSNATLSKRARAASVVTTSRVRDRSVMGLSLDGKQKSVAEKIKAKTERGRNLLAKAGEADRAIQVKKPKHLFAGKRGMGSTDRR